MKKFSYTILLVALVVCSCKKGDEDPFMSLLTRQQRLTGTWDLYSIDDLHMNLHLGDTDLYYHTVGDQNQMTYTVDAYGATQNDVLNDIENTIEIKKDGSWTKVFHFVESSYYEDSESIMTHNDRDVLITETGTWSFVNKSTNYERKEQLLITTLERTQAVGPVTYMIDYKDPGIIDMTSSYPASSFALQFDPQTETKIYDLVMLKNKEMKWLNRSGTVNGEAIAERNEVLVWKKQ
jgi:hypothetical protein